MAVAHVILHVVRAADISDLYCCWLCMFLGVLSCLPNSCSHFAAVSLGELAQAIPPANFETPQSVSIRVGKGLTIDDTHQQLSFGDSPQVIKMHILKSDICSICCFENWPACALQCSTASLMHCL